MTSCERPEVASLGVAVVIDYTFRFVTCVVTKTCTNAIALALTGDVLRSWWETESSADNAGERNGLGTIGQRVLHYGLHRYTINRPLSATQYSETYSLNCRYLYKRL